MTRTQTTKTNAFLCSEQSIKPPFLSPNMPQIEEIVMLTLKAESCPGSLLASSLTNSLPLVPYIPQESGLKIRRPSGSTAPHKHFIKQVIHKNILLFTQFINRMKSSYQMARQIIQLLYYMHEIDL